MTLLTVAFCSDVWSAARRAAEDPEKVQLSSGSPRRLTGGAVGGAVPTKWLSIHPGGRGGIYPGTKVTPGSGHDKRKRAVTCNFG